MTDKPYSPTTLSKRWGCSRQHIHNCIKNKEIQHTFKIGREIRIPAWEVERIESCGTKNQNCSEDITMPDKAQVKIPKGNHLEQTDWMWQHAD